MSGPAFKGGQGRPDAEVVATAMAMVIMTIVAAVILFAAWAAQ